MESSGIKRRKRRSLVQTFNKKFKKNPQRSTGTRLDDDTYEYFVRVFQQSQQEFTEDSEKRIFIDNVFSQTEGHEVEYATNQLVSRVLETFLPECSEAVLLRFIDVFAKDLRPICCNQFASHVLQTLLKISSKRVYGSSANDSKSDTNNESENTEEYLQFVLKVSRFLLNNLDEFILDTYANHVTRAAISYLSGSSVDITPVVKNNGKIEKTHNTVEVAKDTTPKIYPSEFKSLLKQYAEFILNSPRFVEYASNVLMSGLVQIMLLALKAAKRKKYLKLVVEKLLNSIYSPNKKGHDVVELLTTQEAVHLLNTMIIVSSDDMYDEILQRCFSNNMNDMILSNTANYCVQKMIDRCTNPDSFESIYVELSPSFDEILQKRFTGVLFSISKACGRLQKKENTFIKDLKKVLGCSKDCFVSCLLSFHQHASQERDSNKSGSIPVSIHGSLVVQELLKFNKPDKVMKCILGMNSSVLVNILCDQKGSRIANAILSNMKNEEYKTKFIDKLRGSFIALATNKFGSFTLTALWKVASVEQKLVVVNELITKESVLANTAHGNIVARTISLKTYRHQPKEWERAQNQLFSARELFADVIT